MIPAKWWRKVVVALMLGSSLLLMASCTGNSDEAEAGDDSPGEFHGYKKALSLNGVSPIPSIRAGAVQPRPCGICGPEKSRRQGRGGGATGAAKPIRSRLR